MQSIIACEALARQKRLGLRYNTFERIVEVHAVGLTRESNLVMRVWQVRGGSLRNEPVGWKLMRLDEGFSHISSTRNPWLPAQVTSGATRPWWAASRANSRPQSHGPIGRAGALFCAQSLAWIMSRPFSRGH